MTPTILAIESSCDETSAAVISNGKMLANIIAGQEIHAQYGGVIPELASRNHDLYITTVVQAALQKANVSLSEIDAIAATQGPGLLGALLVGYTYAKGLSWSLDLPLIGVNHLQAHIAALFIDNPTVQFPLLVLLVSGGHTRLIEVKSFSDQVVLGETIDDAAGEAYDKVAKLMGLPYPGGPVIDKLSQSGNPLAFRFPQPKVKGLDFSFSGLKTSIRYFLEEKVSKDPDFVRNNKEDLCASVQFTINHYLSSQMEKAILEHKPKGIAIAGGVSANADLRKRWSDLASKHGLALIIPDFNYCTDNAAMIAKAAEFLYESKQFQALSSVPYPR
jgi:N6-L-threonylcarbamoyladenine synthase